MRFASGDEDLRASCSSEFGDARFTNFAGISADRGKRLDEWASDEENGAKKGLPEKKNSKLLDPKTW